MVDNEEKPSPSFGIHWHEPCKGFNLRVITAETEGGADIEVGRCMVCDTAKCPKCAGRVMDPWAKLCPHCKTDIQIKVASTEGN